MNNEIQKRYKKRSEIIKALAHPTRLFIIDFLADGEKCVCEIVEQVGVDISTISKHLLVMKNAGLVESEKRGLNMFYKTACPCISSLFTCLESIGNKD
ncbi:MAG TPA: transcriptional regulator [Cyanobacteria bacterium UBA9971]|nr:transcriptional regulator [Cyanobacteria bacterium UBA9971]